MYIAIDGDSVGKRLQQLILEEKLDILADFSNSIKNTLLQFMIILEQHESIIYMSGGDNIFAECTKKCAEIVVEYVKIINKKNEVHYSVAIGENTQDTFIGLEYAKSSKLHYIEVIRDSSNKVIFQHI